MTDSQVHVLADDSDSNDDESDADSEYNADSEYDYDNEDAEYEKYNSPAHYGESGNIYNPGDHLKWCCDGLSTLTEVASQLAHMAQYYTSLEADGWQLTEAVDGGSIALYWAGEGSPDPAASAYIDGTNAAGEHYDRSPGLARYSDQIQGEEVTF